MLSQASCAAVRVRPPVWKSYAEISRFIRTATRHQGIASHARSIPIICNARIRYFSSSNAIYNEQKAQQLPQFLEDYKSSIRFPPQTCSIASLKDAKVGEIVVLHGYLGNRKDMSKALSFTQLLGKDMTTYVQLISLGKDDKGNEKASHAKLKSLNANSPVIVRGTLQKRIPPRETPATGAELITNVEVNIDEVQLLNDFPSGIVTGQTAFPLEQRHLQIRLGDDLRKALAFRTKVAQLCRQRLIDAEFLEIETPLLFKSTPEGAREFLVPTRTKGLAFALPQSPQQYKQILMASGIPKYFQVARCFRDEDLRADRQPEFTQLDLEMSFATGEDVMQQMEGLIRHLWKDMLGWTSQDAQFLRMTYDDAMATYGSDKPDMRLGMEITRVGHLLPADLILNMSSLHDPIVEVIKLSVSDDPRQTQKFIKDFMDSPDAAPFLNNPEGQPGIFVYDIKKPLSGFSAFGFEATERIEEDLELEQGDLVVLQARKRAPFAGGSTPLGNLRLALHKAARTAGLIELPREFKFLWVTDFPLFSPSNDIDPGQGGVAGLSATHHPFTAPKTPQDVDLLMTDPSAVTAEHYDIVVNGVELGGGSRRIHDARVQEFILRDVLKMSEERLQDFKHLIHVLNAGCPPHAGIALGFDRLIAVMMGKESVRDVIAFPKSGKGEDMLVKSPNAVTKEQLETYHLQLKE